MESAILQQQALRQVADALRHSRSKEGLERRLQEILSENFATLDKAYEQKFQELRNIVSGTPSELIGNTRAMQEVERQIRQIANSEAVVLIRGAAGTGKEHAARTIHSQSERNDKPFVILNCDSLNAGEGINSLDSELFGYERGAFTGATARHLGKAREQHRPKCQRTHCSKHRQRS
jgi:Nif-specific regulatory protein